jgi:DNA (cytosine-5)-methyltransferase 1
LSSPQCQILSRRMRKQDFKTTTWVLNARNFGVAQNRTRTFAIFSKRGIPLSPLERAPTTVREAFSNLPSYPETSIQHFARTQSPQTMRMIRLVPEGGDVRDIAKVAPELIPASWFKTEGKIVDIWGRLLWNDVSNTLRTGFLHPSRGRFLHPSEDRPISFREGARLQSIPDDYQIFGLPEHISRQIGNGVPLNLGMAVARRVFELFS